MVIGLVDETQDRWIFDEISWGFLGITKIVVFVPVASVSTGMLLFAITLRDN